MGEQPQDEVTVRPNVQNLTGIGLADVEGGEGAFVVDEILRMISPFEDGFPEDTESPGFFFNWARSLLYSARNSFGIIFPALPQDRVPEGPLIIYSLSEGWGGQGDSLGILRRCFLRRGGGKKHPASFGGKKLSPFCYFSPSRGCRCASPWPPQPRHGGGNRLSTQRIRPRTIIHASPRLDATKGDESTSNYSG